MIRGKGAKTGVCEDRGSPGADGIFREGEKKETAIFLLFFFKDSRVDLMLSDVS